MSPSFDANQDAIFAGSVSVSSIGDGFRVAEGSNARMGISTLSGGTVTVTNNTVTANTRIFMSRQTTGGVTGQLSCTRVANTSFTINSSSALDTSTVCWELKEPA